MKYPNLNREDKLSTKLSWQDILDIRLMKINGMSIANMAFLKNVSRSTIRYWLATDDEREAINKKRKFRSRKSYDETKQSHKQYFQRKRGLQDKEFMSYKAEVNARYRLNNLEKVRAKDREYNRNKRKRGAIK